jgi:secreted PhoX family phosphatase
MQRRTALVAGGAAGTGLLALMVTRYFAGKRSAARCLAADLVCDPKGHFDLADGFTNQILQEAGDRMNDGFSVPDYPDSMACFEQGGQLVLYRNHEISLSDHFRGPFQKGQERPPAGFIFDGAAPGGVTRLVLDQRAERIVTSSLVLAGTARNCSGGVTPWGWFSCEETVEPGHGYVFHVPLSAQGLVEPLPLRELGRMNHEAATADPRTGTVYLTEDRDDGLFYRFVPAPGQAWEPEMWTNGALQALSVKGFEGQSLNGLQPGRSVEVSWLTLSDPDSADDSLRSRGRAAGASVVQRGEGLWYDNGRVLFSATSGGAHNRGQIFELQIPGNSAEPSGEKLTVLAEGKPEAGLYFPDNLCVGPSGSIFIAEDNISYCRLQVLTSGGEVKTLGMNRKEGKELTGVCFSPRQDVLFCNLQKEGLTLAIRGPFERFIAGA